MHMVEAELFSPRYSISSLICLKQHGQSWNYIQTNDKTDSADHMHMHVHMYTDTCYNNKEKDAIIWKWVGDMGGVKGQVAGRDWKEVRHRRKWQYIF